MSWPKKPYLVGPPKAASNAYIVKHLQSRCVECPCCGGTWQLKTKASGQVCVQVQVGGRTMTARKAAYMASFPEKPIQKGRRITSWCRNPLCINPAHLSQATAGHVISLQFKYGARDLTKHRTALAGKSKISAEDAVRIMADDRTGKEIAKDYGISAHYANEIKRGAARRQVNPFAGLMR